MIEIKIHDTIVDIIDKMNLVTGDDIILDFPLGHPILHNYISLKILKSKADNKKLIIATSDKIGKKIGKQIGIEYSLIKNKGFIEKKSSETLLGHNYTFWEYLKFQITGYKNELTDSIQSHKKFHTLGKYSRASYEKISISIFILGLLLSLVIFVFIYYFAISKTYITITPDIIVKNEAYNFVFIEDIPESVLGNNRYVKIESISKTLYSSDTYAATEILENNNIASGEIQVFNFLDEEQTLVPNTRFVTDDGIIFRTNNWISIPAAVKDNFGNTTPGVSNVTIKADIKDESGSYIGSRGNITSETSLTIPGLGEDLQTEIYGVVSDGLTGGSNDFQNVISQDDIDRALDIFTNKIKNEVIVSIKNNILSENNTNSTSVDILPGAQSIRYSEPTINIEAGVNAGDIRDNFKVEGNITAYVYTYNKETVIQRLKTLLSEKRLEGIEKINYVDENSLRMAQVIYSENDPFSIKSTFELEAVYIHDFLHENNNFVNALKQEIRGMNKTEAESFLLNNPKISNVSINIRPFFSKNISSIYNNIIFNIE